MLVMAFLISPMGLPLAAIWLLGKVQSLKFAIQEMCIRDRSMALADALMPCPAQHTAAKITTGKGCTIKSRTARMFT